MHRIVKCLAETIDCSELHCFFVAKMWRGQSRFHAWLWCRGDGSFGLRLKECQKSWKNSSDCMVALRLFIVLICVVSVIFMHCMCRQQLEAVSCICCPHCLRCLRRMHRGCRERRPRVIDLVERSERNLQAWMAQCFDHELE